METPPRPIMHIRPVSDIWVSACQVGCGPLLTSVSASNGTAATRHSHANRSNIGTPCARRSSRLPAAKLSGEIIRIAKALTLKS